MWIKLGALIFILVAVGGSIFAVKGYVENQAATIERLTSENSELRSAAEVLVETNSALVGAVDDWAEAQRNFEDTLQELQNASVEASEERRRLNGLLTRHDLTDLSQRRPGLIEPRINAGTADAYRMFECATGAVHSECPASN